MHLTIVLSTWRLVEEGQWTSVIVILATLHDEHFKLHLRAISCTFQEYYYLAIPLLDISFCKGTGAAYVKQHVGKHPSNILYQLTPMETVKVCTQFATHVH